MVPSGRFKWPLSGNDATAIAGLPVADTIDVVQQRFGSPAALIQEQGLVDALRRLYVARCWATGGMVWEYHHWQDRWELLFNQAVSCGASFLVTSVGEPQENADYCS